MNVTHTMSERPVRSGGLIGSAILIGLGLIFLLNNLGVLGWEVWETLGRLWPILLIGVGLDLLIGRRSALGSLLVVVIMLGVLGAAVWFSGAWLPSGQALIDETISQPLDNATRADIDIGLAAGTLRIGALAESANLIEGSVSRGERNEVQRDFSVSGDTATFKLHSRNQAVWRLPFVSRSGDPILWDLRLNGDVPIKMALTTGAGSATLDLSRLHITDMQVTTGVGTTTLTLPQQGTVQAKINGGVGETTIMIPPGMAARIEATTGLGQVQVLGNYQRQGKLYISPGYDTATNRVDLQVTGGVGSVTIQQDLGR
jgi:Cell wall-active antibiotics response 4TMS YvqF/Domain of unknown function (DUF5668)